MKPIPREVFTSDRIANTSKSNSANHRHNLDQPKSFSLKQASHTSFFSLVRQQKNGHPNLFTRHLIEHDRRDALSRGQSGQPLLDDFAGYVRETEISSLKAMG